MSYADDLAHFVTSSHFDDIPATAVASLKRSILDAIGCAIAAVDAEPVQAVRQALTSLGGSEGSSLIGGGRTSPDRAALHNGAAVRYLDYNDTYLGALEGGHPSDNLAPVLAVAEHSDRTGKDFLLGLALAYQIQCRLIEAAPVRGRGFDHTTLGPYAVAGSVSRMLGLDDTRTANAIRIAGTALNALRVARTGRISHWKGLAYPSVAGNATEAAYLAMSGVTGPELVFEGAKGFMDTIAGDFRIAWREEQFTLIEDVIFKRYNAEGHSQTALEALQIVKRDNDFVSEDIDEVQIEVFSACYNIIGGGDEGDKHVVTTKEEADHSLPYMAAVLLLDDELTPSQYTAARIEASDVQALLRRVNIVERPELNARFPAEMPSVVRVRLKTGEVFEREQSDYLGYRTRPMTWQDVETKFRQLVSTTAFAAQADRIASVVSRLDEVDRISELTDLLRDPVSR